MKGRSVLLKETHKNNGNSSCSSILWDHQANHIITASDHTLLIHPHPTSSPPDPPLVLRHHKAPVTTLALSPDSKCLASGSVDHSVKLYSFPGGEFQNNVTRFTLPIRSLAFNRSGTLLAAAGDDEGIKLISTIDNSITRVLKAHKGPVTGLEFDCKDEYLASVDGFGTVIYWELSSGKSIHTLKISPNFGSDNTISSGLGWSPDGEMLAVAGLKNDVVMYDRDTAEKLFSLKGGHEQSVCFLSWSPNGKYMATAGLDKQVLIWDLDQRQDIDRQKFGDRICCLAWKPNGNALAVIDVMGKFGVWEPAVPSHMKSPTDGAPSFRTGVSDEFLMFDEEEQEPRGSLDQVGEDSNGESAPISRKRLRKKPVFNDESDKDSDSESDLLRLLDSHKKPHGKYTEHVEDRNEEVDSLLKPGLPKIKMQDAFQPGATPAQAGKRRFLCYNMVGSITTLENDGFSHIEVDFHDTGRGPRVPSMTDYFGFTMAALNETGSVFANPHKGEKSTSTLMYRPFSSWANNSEWSMRFEAEEVKAVALGVGWVAAVTSLNFLRIFSEGGLQRCILSLEGPVVTTAGFKDQLVVITHASDCLSSGDQMLEFEVFNIPKGIRTLKGRLPLTSGSFLTWFGFSEEGQLSSYDSKGVLRVFTNEYGGTWLPLFSAIKERKSPENENYWVVGLNSTKVFCVVCKSPDMFPPVMPKPILTPLSLSLPLASSDLGADDLENEFMMSNLQLSQVQRKIEEAEATGLDTTSLDDEAFSIEAALDRCILRLIANCCKGDKLVRATELAKLLSLEKSLKGAIKLVTAMKLPILAERLNGILEERLLNEAEEATMPAKPVSYSSAGTQKMLHVAESVTKVTPPVPVPPPRLPPPVFLKKEKVEEKLNMGVEKIESERNGNEGNRKAESNMGQLQRPSNPFAKVSNKQEKSSLVDSIKKMKVENESKDKEAVDEGKRKERPGLVQQPKSRKQAKK